MEPLSTRMRAFAERIGIDPDKQVQMPSDEEIFTQHQREAIAERMNVLPPKFRQMCIQPFPEETTQAITKTFATTASLYLHGKTGVGKSVAAAFMAKMLIERGLRVAWIHAGEMMAEAETFQSKVALLGRWKAVFSRVDVVVLDDIGAEDSSNERDQETLEVFVNALDYSGVQRIVTSNLAPKELVTKLGPRIASRLVDHAVIHRMEGGNRRVESAIQMNGGQE